MALFDEAEHFFHDYNQMTKCVGLVITKIHDESTPTEVLNYCDDPRLTRSKLFKFFLEHPERCFTVPIPNKSGNYNSFEDREKIIDFLKTNSVENPQHNIILDRELFDI